MCFTCSCFSSFAVFCILSQDNCWVIWPTALLLLLFYFRSPFWYPVTYLLIFSHFYKLILDSTVFP
jgi:hypothetical protein